MDPEVLIGIIAVFISGGALGTAGTLFIQWMQRKVMQPFQSPPPLDQEEVGMLRRDVAELTRTVRSLNERMDFQERLLTEEGSGGSGTHRPPGPV